MGPEGGDKGGEIVVAGTPEDVAACESSWTGRYLKPCLEQASADDAGFAARRAGGYVLGHGQTSSN